jgi:hypothetical protein
MNSLRLSSSRSLRVLTACALLLSSSPAVAQKKQNSKFVTPGKAELELNREGIEALNQKDYEKATRLFQTSLDLKALNITYLNYGRALYYQGRCHEADAAYEQALKTTLQVAKPDPATIADTVRKYRGDLLDNCQAELRITCSPAQMTLRINEGPELPCDAKPLKLDKGSYTIVGSYQEQQTQQQISLRPMDRHTISLSIQVVEREVVKEVVVEKEVPVETIVEKEVIKEVPVEREIVKEVPVEREIVKEVVKETPRQEQPTQVVIQMPNQNNQQDVPEKSNFAAWMNLSVGLTVLAGGAVMDGIFARDARDKAGVYNAADWTFYSIPVLLYIVGSIFTINGLTKF